MTSSGDLVSLLLEAIKQVEQDAPTIHSERCDSLPPPEGYDGPFPCDCGVPSSVLRHCEADRMILQQHQPINDVDWICGVCIEPGYIGVEYRMDWPTVPAPCPTLAALASAYGLSVEEETTRE